MFESEILEGTISDSDIKKAQAMGVWKYMPKP